MTSRFEIPDTMREFAEKSVDQARKAFDDYMTAAQRAAGASEDSASGSGMDAGASAMHAETIAFAEATVAANFELARRLVRAEDPQEMARIQQEFLDQQMAAFADQSRRLTEIATAAAAGKDDKSRR